METSKSPRRLIRLLRRGALLLTAYGGLVASSDRALAASDDAYPSLVATARTLEKIGNLASAQRTIEAAIAMAPNRHEAHVVAGTLARKSGNEEAARAELEQALALAPAADKPAIQVLLDAGAPALSADDRRVLDAISLIAREADAAGSGEGKRKLWADYASRSAIFARAHPELTDVWRWRALAALELSQARVGREAAQILLKVPNPGQNLRYVLGQLERRAWTTVVRIRTTMPPGPGAPLDMAGKSLKAGRTGIKLRWIAPGTFKMGTTQRESSGPTVTLTRGFWIGETEVKQAQWEDFMGTNPSNFQQRKRSLERMALTIIGDDRPVEQLTWFEAMDFCRRLTVDERTAGRVPPGYEYRLPTEAEWEYACRAGTTGDYNGPDLDRIAWYDKNSDDMSHDVAAKRSNAWGLYDMAGNVAEWCYDWSAELDQSEYTDRVILDPDPDDRKGAVRIIRGGSWLNVAPRCLSAARAADDPGNAVSYVGFRIVLGPAISSK